jgi:hypothetical protein
MLLLLLLLGVIIVASLFAWLFGWLVGWSIDCSLGYQLDPAAVLPYLLRDWQQVLYCRAGQVPTVPEKKSKEPFRASNRDACKAMMDGGSTGAT